MPAIAADIPIELYDLILSFYMFDYAEGTDWHDYQRLNHVAVNREQLGSLRLVCRDWARFLQPTVFKETIILQGRGDVDALLGLLAKPNCHIAEYVRHLQCKQSVTTYPIVPWIHVICLKLAQVLPHASLRSLAIQGPLPLGESLSSIHGVLPRRLPTFATGICHLQLTNLHLKSLRNLVQFVKEMPSLASIVCSGVTWDDTPDRLLPAPHSYLHTDMDNCFMYQMARCTDNTAAAWLLWSLALTGLKRLRQGNSDTLCHIASAIIQVDVRQYPDWRVVSSYLDGCLSVFVVPDSLAEFNGYLTPSLDVYLVPPVSGEQTRRVRSVELVFEDGGVRVPDMLGWDWSAVDARLADMHSLETVLLVFHNKDDLLIFAREVVAPRMPRLRDSPRLQYILRSTTGPRMLFTHDMIETI